MGEATICQVLHSLTVGGAEVLADRLARRLSGRYRFVFACLDGLGELGETLRADGFPVQLLGRQSGLDWKCPRSLARFVRDEGVDIVHAHQYTPFFYSLAARPMGARRPILFTEHGRFFPDLPSRKRILFNRLMLGGRDRVFGVGNSVRQALIDNEGLPPNRVEVIYNGVNLKPYEDGHLQQDEVRQELGLSPEDFVIAQVARLDHLKDHLTAVRTIDHLRNEVPNVKLIIVGEGPERPQIEQEIAKRQLEDSVTLLGLRQDVPRIWSAANACLLTSISEGIPLTLIEGMAAGLPIVSTDVGGVSEVVEDGEVGLLAPSGDDKQLAAKLSILAKNDALRTRLGDNGRKRAWSTFSEESMHHAYAQVYDEMLSAAGRMARPVVSAAVGEGS